MFPDINVIYRTGTNFQPINWIEAPARAAVEEVAENKTVRELLEINPHKCKVNANCDRSKQHVCLMLFRPALTLLIAPFVTEGSISSSCNRSKDLQ